MYRLESIKQNNCKICEDRSCAVSTLSKNQLEILSNNCVESKVKKGEIILRSGAMISHIIYLKTGFVKEFIVGEDDKSKILQIVKPHSYLGLHSLFGDKINHYSYSALEDLKICYIDINIFNQFIKEKGDFAYEILSSVSKESLNNFFRFINQSNKRINGRFADVLLYFSEKIFNSLSFNILLSRQELADLIGISRENTARVLSKFEADRIINISGKNIEIIKTDLLWKISKNG